MTDKKLEAQALASGLKLVGKRQPFLSYLKDAYQRRVFGYTMARYSLQARTAKSQLGIALLVIVPAAQILLYGLIFGFILGTSKPANFLPFLITGVVFFQLFSGAFSSGTKSITSNSSLVKSLNFPRLLLPISAVISETMKFLPLFGVVMIGLVILHEPVTVAWLLIVPIIALAVLMAVGIAAIAARLTTMIRDIGQFTPFITRVAFYLSGVFWSFEKVFHGHPTAIVVLELNPIYAFLALARGVLVSGYSTTPTLWYTAIIWTFATLIGGLAFFWQAEERYSRAA